MNGLATGFEFVFALVLMLGVVVTIHELGHFWAAKACGVRVLKFSIGFGNPIGIGRFRLRWQRRGTEYVIAWFPLGGFVKMLGEATDDDAHVSRAAPPPPDSLAAQPLWKKLTIVLAGPVMNLLLPVVVVAASLWVGVERRDPTVGTVEPGSPAAVAGILPGDRVLALDGEQIRFWDDLERAVRERPGAELALSFARGEERFERRLAVEQKAGLDLLGQKSDVGWLGLQHHRQSATLGIPSRDAPAAKAGLRSGDRVVALAGAPVEDWNAFAAAYAAAPPGELTLRVARGEGEAAEESDVRVPALGDVARLGVIPAVVLVAAVSPGMPAAEAGIQPGDLLVAVGGEPVGSFGTFRETVLASEGKPLDVTVAHGGETRVLSLAARLGKAAPEDPQEQYLIGISAVNATLPGPSAIDRVRNPLVALPRAVVATVETTGTFLAGLGRIVSGDISRRSIGGPIEIARQSHLALQRGWETFVSLLVIISINLGVLNLLPIPILDGGQAVLFTLEGLKRGPLPRRALEWVQQVGLFLLVGLMGFALWNDVSRYWASFFEWLKGLSS
jgi:regulator of sigma E protease